MEPPTSTGFSSSAAGSVPVPLTERVVWPDSREAAPVTSSTDVLLTAWLRPRTGGELDADNARKLAATPPLLRTYLDRTTLERQTDADPEDVELLRRYCERFGLSIVDTRWRSVVVRGPIERLVSAFGATVAVFEDGGG
ncbi:MAG TPA: hypothetical protein VIG32_12285, partial [Candidatus Baltobacteraceae bacterium]